MKTLILILLAGCASPQIKINENEKRPLTAKEQSMIGRYYHPKHNQNVKYKVIGIDIKVATIDGIKAREDIWIKVRRDDGKISKMDQYTFKKIFKVHP